MRSSLHQFIQQLLNHFPGTNSIILSRSALQECLHTCTDDDDQLLNHVVVNVLQIASDDDPAADDSTAPVNDTTSEEIEIEQEQDTMILNCEDVFISTVNDTNEQEHAEEHEEQENEHEHEEQQERGKAEEHVQVQEEEEEETQVGNETSEAESQQSDNGDLAPTRRKQLACLKGDELKAALIQKFDECKDSKLTDEEQELMNEWSSDPAVGEQKLLNMAESEQFEVTAMQLVALGKELGKGFNTNRSQFMRILLSQAAALNIVDLQFPKQRNIKAKELLNICSTDAAPLRAIFKFVKERWALSSRAQIKQVFALPLFQADIPWTTWRVLWGRNKRHILIQAWDEFISAADNEAESTEQSIEQEQTDIAIVSTSRKRKHSTFIAGDDNDDNE